VGDLARKLTVLLPLLAVIAVIGYCLGGTAYIDYRMTLWQYACAAAVCAAFPLLLVRKHSRAAKIVALVIYLLAASYAWVDVGHTRRPFLNDLFSVKPGMSIAEARSRMSKWTAIPVTGEIRAGSGELSYRHCDCSAYGADIGSITFSHGRVVNVGFSPD
jgi:hypothetical protein